MILGSMTKEHEDPFGRWLCEELERQNPEDVAMIVKAEQETQTSPDDVVDAKEHSELKTLLAQHHQKCFEVYCKGYTRIEEAVFDKIKIAGMTMVSFMRIFSGRGAENKIFRRRQILAVFDEAQDYHLFQALGMASLVDAAIFLQDKQQTFQRTDAGVMDRDQNYWASLFGAYSNILEAPRSTLQNTSNIVQVVDQRSMLVTYRMGHMALDGYHALCCADKGSESGMSLRAGDKPYHTACALVVINSDDDSGILPQRTEHALHCQDRVMPSYRYFAVMAHIALEFLMKYDECAILTCYKLQKEFLLPLLVKSISSLANLRKLDQFTASHRVQAKLSFIDPANLNDYNDRLHETRWACKDADDTDKMVLLHTAHHTARASKGFTFKAVIALVTKRDTKDRAPLGIAFSSNGVRTVLMTRASQALVVILDDWIMRQDDSTCRKKAAAPNPEDSGDEKSDSSRRCNWKVLQQIWPTFRFEGAHATLVGRQDAQEPRGQHSVSGENAENRQPWTLGDAPEALRRIQVSQRLGSGPMQGEFDQYVENFSFASLGTKKKSDAETFKDLADATKMRSLLSRIIRSGESKGQGKGKNRFGRRAQTPAEEAAWVVGRAKVNAFAKNVSPDEYPDDQEDPPQRSLGEQCLLMTEYLLDAVHWNLNMNHGEGKGNATPPKWPHLVSIPFWRLENLENRETRYTETCWHEQHILGGIIRAANDDVPLRLELRSHKANKIVTKHASHYWRECRSERVALQVIQKDQAMMHIYHAMGVHRQHAQVRTMVVRMRNMKAVGMLCKAFHDFLSNVGLTVDKSRMALWPADGDSAEKTRNALEYLYQEGSRQHFERFLELEDEK